MTTGKKSSRFVHSRLSRFIVPAFLILILLGLVIVFVILILSVTGITPGS